MNFRAGRNKQLAAAVTLAVMGMAAVAVPQQQAWAGSFGTEAAPMQYEKYVEEQNNGIIASAEKDGQGDAVYTAQYHQIFGVFGDLQGQTMTINDMTVGGITGASGIGSDHGSDADTAKSGIDGGLAWAAGLASNNLSNAVISIGSV